MSAPFLLAARGGLIGLGLAVFIYMLWKISVRIYGVILPDKYSGELITFSGVLLWIAWFATTQVIMTAYDELGLH